MKRVLHRLWSVYFYFLFFVYFAILFPVYFVLLLFKSNVTHDFAHNMNRVWGRFISIPSLIRISSEGRQHLDKKSVYVFAPNHRSYMDIPACNVGIPHSFRFMGKAELNAIPFFGWMFSRLHISVKRESKTSSYQSFIRAKEKIQSGRSVLVFPEGGIPHDKRPVLFRFKDGAFRLAIENEVPIVPVSIVGADKVFPDDGRLLVSPGRIKVKIHQPIQTKGLVVDDMGNLKQQVHDVIRTHLESQQAPSKNIA